jgi:GWxTD domain-containing protein
MSPTLAAWSDGPVRWLLLPDERRTFERLRSDPAATVFIAAFWRRRDPDPDTPENPFADTFSERVESADRLYGEEGTRGSLTDRGGALILLGPPGILRAQYRRTPVWEPRRARGAATREVPVEQWGYRVEELPPELVDLAPHLRERRELTLTFLVESRRFQLIEGRAYLELAARAAVFPSASSRRQRGSGTGITDRRGIRTSSKSRNAPSALIAASVTGRPSGRSGTRSKATIRGSLAAGSG